MAIEALIGELRLDVTRARNDLRAFRGDVERHSQQSSQSLGTLNRSVGSLTGGFTLLRGAVAAVGLVAIGRAAIQTSVQFQAFQRSMAQATGSVALARAEMAFASQEAFRLGVTLAGSTEGLRNLINATRGTSLAGAATREIFSALNETFLVLGLSTDQYGRALAAVTQIAQKGRFQQEELLQLAEAGVPVYQALARALNQPQEALAKLLETGTVGREALLPLARTLREEIGGGARDASQSFAAAAQRIENAVTEVSRALGDLVTKNPETVKALNAVAEGIRSVARAAEEGQGPTSLFLQLFNRTATGFGLFLQDLTKSPLDRQMQVVNEQIAQTEQRLAALKQQPSFLESLLGANLEQRTEQLRDLLRELERLRHERALIASERIQQMRVRSGFVPETLDESNAPQVTSRALAGLISQQGRAAFAEASGSLGKLRQEITQTQNLISQAGLIGLTPAEVDFLRERLKGLEEQLTKTLSPARFKAQQEASQAALAQEKELLGQREQLAQQDIEAFRHNLEQQEQFRTEALQGSLQAEQQAFQETMARLTAKEAASNEVEQELQRLTLSTTDFELAEFQRRLAAFEDAGIAQERIAQLREAFIQDQTRRTTEKQQRELEKQQREFDRTAERIADKSADILFPFIDGIISGAQSMEDIFRSTLGTIRQLFSRAIAEMIAEALAKPIIIPIVQSFFGTTGVGVGSGNGFGGVNLGTTGVIGQSLNTPLFGTGFSGAQGPGLSGATLGTGAITGSSILTGVGLGITTGYALRSLNDTLGITGAIGSRGSSALAGAGGGALAGTLILPGIGTIIGAVVGAGLGALLGGGPKQRQVFTEQFDLPRFLATETGLGITGSTQIGTLGSRNDVGQDTLDLLAQITAVSDNAFRSIAERLSGVPEGMAAGVAAALNEVTETIDAELTQIVLSAEGAGIKTAVQKFLTDFPAALEEQFTPLFAQLQRIIPFAQGLDQALTALEQQRDQLLGTIRGARRTIEEALLTPGIIFERRRADLQQLLLDFDVAEASRQAQLVPQISALAQEVFQLAQQEQVFGQDPGALRGVQRELLAILDELGADTRGIFGGRMTEAEQQLAVLNDFKNVTDAQLTQTNIFLAQIVAFLQRAQTPFVGTFQEGGIVPATGLALVHRGETVVPAGQTFAMALTVNVQGGASPAMTGRQIGEAAWQYIEQQARRRAIPLRMGR